MDAPTDVSAAPDAQGPPTGPRRLRRRPDDGHIAGVCAGVAEYFNVDPVIVRIAAVVLLVTGPGAFAYVLAWIFVPPVPGPAVHGAPQALIDSKDRATQVFGIVLIVLAVSVVWGDWWSPARHWLLPLGLMGLGAWLLLRRDTDDAVPPVPPPSPPMPPPAAWAWGGGAGDVVDPTTEVTQTAEDDDPTSSTLDTDTDVLTDPDARTIADAGIGGFGFGPPAVPPVPPPLPVPPSPTAPSRRRVLGPIVFGVLLVWAGLAFLLDVTLETGLAGGLLILGVGFVLGAFVGGSRVLILPALLVGAALTVTAIVDIPLDGPVGRQQWTPSSLAALDDSYAVSLGEGTLDLQAVEIPAGERVEVAATAGVGHLVVLVPDGMAVEVTTDVGAGESDVFGLQQNGVSVTTDQRSAGDAASGTLVLDVQIGVGQVEVRRIPALVTTATSTTPTSVLG